MRLPFFILVCLALVSPLAAETAPQAATQTAAVTPTVTPTLLSTPAVTPDARFNMPDYSSKWPHISLEEAKRLQARKDVVFVDGRARVEWEQSHIPGAVSLPLGEFDPAYGSEIKKLKHARILISYCHGEGCRLSDMLAQKLISKGHHNVAVFWGGFPAWTQAGLPMQDKHGKAVANPAAPTK